MVLKGAIFNSQDQTSLLQQLEASADIPCVYLDSYRVDKVSLLQETAKNL